MSKETKPLRPYLFKTDLAEFPFGYLEWKPEMEKPDTSDDNEAFDIFLKRHAHYESDQQAIERSRVEVSEELKQQGGYKVVWAEDAHKPLEYFEGKDFTIRDGKAYPVELSGNSEQLDLKDEIAWLNTCVSNLREVNEQAAKNQIEADAELSRLRAENESLKEALTKISVYADSDLYETALQAIKKVALETLK